MAHTLPDELIQVAGVAVAIVEDLLFGVAAYEPPDGSGATRTELVLEHVAKERQAQEAKWGPQHHEPMEWLAILGEEVGEANTAALEAHEWPARQQAVIDEED